MGSCVLDFNAKDSLTGEIKPDILWNELKNMGYSHTNAKIYYGIATDSKFQEYMKDKLDYNTLNIPTAASLFKALGEKYDKEMMRKTLLRTIGLEAMDYNSALYHIQSYNNNTLHSDFMLSFSEEKDGNVRIQVVDKNDKNQAKLVNMIKKRGFVDRMLFYLRRAGVDVTLSDNIGKALLSPENAEINCLGLLELIKLSDGSISTIREDLARICGLYIIKTIPNDVHIKRLLTVVEKQEFIDAYLKQFPDLLLSLEGPVTWEDIAAHIIGERLKRGADIPPTNILSKLVNKLSNIVLRIISKALNVFKNIPYKEFRASLLQAEDIADDISKGFASPSFEGNVGKYIDTVNNIVSIHRDVPINYTTNIKVAKLVLKEMSNWVSKMKTHDLKTYIRLRDELANAENQFDLTKIEAIDSSIMDELALSAIKEAMLMLINNYTDIVEDLLHIDFNNEADFVNNMGKHANSIVRAFEYALVACTISKLIGAYTVGGANMAEDSRLKGFNEIHVIGRYGLEEIISLKDLNNKLKELIQGEGNLIDGLNNLKRAYVLRFLKEAIGSDSISRSLRILFSSKNKGYSSAKTDKVSMELLIDELGADISWWSKNFRSVAENPDIVAQVFDLTIKAAKALASRNFLETRQLLLELDNRMKALKVNPDRLYETEEVEIIDPKTGKKTTKTIVTGYIKLEVSYSKWRNNYDEMVEEKRKEFEEKYGKDTLEGMMDEQRALAWATFFDSYYKRWHRENSVRDPKTKRYKPKEELYSTKNTKNSWFDLNDNEKIIIKEYLEIKAKLDSCIPDGSTDLSRAPQIIGSTVNLIHNRRVMGENLPKAVLNSLFRNTCNLVVRNVNDTEFGSDKTVNSKNILIDDRAYEDNKLERIPLFYINRLPQNRKALLSTDLIGATIAYAAMAHLYKQLNAIKGSLLLTLRLMLDRTVNGLVDNGRTNAYQRISTFMDKELYGMLYNMRMSATNALISKVVGLTTALASRLFLGGNVAGGAANLFMGINEIVKEAFAGEYFDKKALAEANKEYFGFHKDINPKDFISNNLLFDYFKLVKDNKVNLWGEMFDTFGDNSRQWREYDFRNKNIEAAKRFDIFWHNAFAPYASGDHYMQLIPFIALAKSIKLYYMKGGELVTTNMYDIYVKEKGIYHTKKTILKPIDELIVKNPKDIKLAIRLKEMIKDLEKHIESMKGLNFTPFNKEKYQDIIDKYNLKIEDSDNSPNNASSLSIISQALHDMTWQHEDEIKYKNKARIIGNRMHGIYNQADKVGILQTILGAMTLAMRGYALGMIERRWGGGHYSLALLKDVEGSMVTFIKTISQWIYNKDITMSEMLMMLFLPTIKSTQVKELMLDRGFSENQYYNMRRNFADWMVILICSILTGGIFSMFGFSGILGRPDDSDKKDYYPENEGDYIPALLYYFVSRLYIENAAYNEITSFTQIEAPSVFSLVGSNIAAGNAVLRIINGYIDGEYEQGPHKGENKGTVRLLKYAPYFRWKYGVGENPRKAAETYEVKRSGNSRG